MGCISDGTYLRSLRTLVEILDVVNSCAAKGTLLWASPDGSYHPLRCVCMTKFCYLLVWTRNHLATPHCDRVVYSCPHTSWKEMHSALVHSPWERLHPFGRLDIMWEIHKCIKRAQPELSTTSTMPRVCSMCVFDGYLINWKELALVSCWLALIKCPKIHMNTPWW